MKQTKSINKLSLVPVLVGLGVACVFSLATVFLGALLINKEYVGENVIIMFQMVAHFVSAILGCFVAERLSTSNKILLCGITGISYYLILLATSSLFFDGISGKFWTGAVSVLVAYLLTALWILKPQRSKGRPKHKLTYR